MKNNGLPITSREIVDHIGSKGRLGAYLNTVVADLNIDNRGEYLRTLFAKYDEELYALLSNLERDRDQTWLENLIVKLTPRFQE